MSTSKTKRILITLSVLIVVVVMALHFVLQKALTQTLRSAVFPALEKQLNISLKITYATLNLAKGFIALEGLNVGSPEEFPQENMLEIGKFELDLAMPTLLRPPARIPRILMKDARVRVVRNRNGKINLLSLSKQAEASPASTSTASPSQQKTHPRLDLRLASLNTVLEYVDYQLCTDPAQPFRLPLQVKVNAENIATCEMPDKAWGSLAIQAYLENDSNVFVTDLAGAIAPLTDPNHPSFNLKGTIASINLTSIPNATEVMNWLGISGDSASAEITLVCQNGMFVPIESLVKIKIQNPQLKGDLARDMVRTKLPTDLTILVPIDGPFNQPVIHWKQALTRSLIDLGISNLDNLIKGLDDDDKQIANTIKNISDALGNDAPAGTPGNPSSNAAGGIVESIGNLLGK